jgi:ribonucleoside-diphosphate reductase alpha chain
LDVTHRDINEFLDIRRATGDINRRCLNINQGVNVTDAWMNEMLAGDQGNRDLWKRILTTRVETGEPYLFFTDTVNRANPECYTKNDLSVKFSNLCTEIMLHTDDTNSFICCLSSLNLARYEEWKDTDLPNVAARFLDAVLEEYIQRASFIKKLQNSVNSAIAGRAIGIGVLGWHTFLQNKGIPFDSFESMRWNAEIFRNIQTKAREESRKMAIELGEPEWCRGFGMRTTHLMAVAPTLSNSTISGGVSAGIEPILANCYTQEGAQGTFFRTNAALEAILEQRGRNDPNTWKSIVENQGSVQHLDCLFGSEKEVFLTAREINQFAIVKQAGQRQKYIDQGQSVNLFFASNAPPKYVHDVHVEAWRAGLKTLYYCKSKGVLKGDMASRSKNECAACEG